MFFVAAPSQYDAARIFSIPAGICVFIGLTGFVLNGYALRPAEAAKAQAGRMHRAFTPINITIICINVYR